MLVELHRGRIVESCHRVHVAVVDRVGALVASAGNPDLVTFTRSTAKPFQALPLVEDGVIDRFGLTAPELALCCASHSSEPAQVDVARGLLRKIGCGENDLLCGPHPPLSERVTRDYAARGVPLGPIHSNCSGKHAGMLALARHHGWPTAGYVRPDHPVQRRCLEEMAWWTGVPSDQVGTAVDGCGVVCFAVRLRSLAFAYARLGSGERGAGAGRVVDAMLAHPELIAGEGRPCTEIMRAHPGRVVAKVGAEGVYAALVLPQGFGVALKVDDGHDGAAALTIAAVLAELGLASPPSLAERPVLNSRGERVGELRVNGRLARQNDDGSKKGDG
ncbi:MAG: asparaginase [Gemmatimonadales bacterium]